jgi:diguanylate cyclase (GGDEF)-like protein
MDRRTLPTALLAEQLGLASLLARETRDGIAIVGSDGGLIFWNAAAGAITGWSTLAIAEQNVGRFTMTPQALVEIRETKWVEVRQSRLQANGSTYTVVLFTDATSHVRLKDARQQLRSLGLVDHATNLAGREIAMLHIEQAILLAQRDKRSVGLLSLKLDRFRQLRDGADGVAAADEVVRQFAKRISAFARTSDVPARLSDDSFLVVLTALTTSNDAAVVAVRLLLVLAEPFDVVGHARAPCTAASACRNIPATRRSQSLSSGRRSRPPTARRSWAAVATAWLRRALTCTKVSWLPPLSRPRPVVIAHVT